MKKLISRSFLLAMLMMLISIGDSVWAQSVMLFQSRPYVASSTAEDHFQDNINLKPGQENLPLTLVVRNGGEGKRPFNWFRLNIAGYLLASEKDLAGRSEGSIDVSGRIQPGGGQVMIDAAGEPGATMSFYLMSSPVALSSVQPTSVEPGQHIVLRGSGFSNNEAQDTVMLGSTTAEVLSASPTSITALVPSNMQHGKTQVKVIVNGLQTQALELDISNFAAPQLLSTNYWMAPPGAQLIIKGKNFAPAASENQVYFNTVAGQVVSATTDTITVIVPQWSFGPQQLNIPLSVVSRGVRSSNFLRFDFGPKYQGAWPQFPGDSSSQASP